MKILFVSNNLGQGGKERQIHELLKFFQAHTNFQFGLLLRENIVKYDLSEISQTQIFKPSERLSPPQFRKHASKAIEEFKPDLIHTWEGGTAFIVTLLKLSRYPKIPIIDGTLRYANTFAKTTKYYWVERFNRTIAKKVVANSNAGLKSIDYGTHGKYLVIPNGMDFKRFHPKEKNETSTGILIGMTASFSKPKDYKSLITTGKYLLQKGYPVKFVFIGDGPEKKDCQSFVPSEYADKFEFTGNITSPEKYLALMDIGVLLNKKGESEGMSNSVMEYMAFGLPVVCTDTGGNPDMVTDNLNGFLTTHENQDQIRAGLEKLVKDPVLRKQMGEHSAAIAHKNFDINQVAQRYLNLYHEVSGLTPSAN